MKRISSMLLAVGLWASAGAMNAANPYRTDVNPALLYWQAFMQLPTFSESDRKPTDYLTGAPLDDQVEALAGRYDHVFELVRRAAQLPQPCDWGIDLADGPDTLLPHLAKAKAIAQAARFRARVFLQRGQENEAVQDLLAAFVLGRRLSNDGVLISALVQIAIENLVIGTVAENYYAFSTEGLNQVVAGIDASPARGTVSQSIGTGERICVDWFVRHIEMIRAAHPGDEAKALSEIRELLTAKLIEENGTKNYDQADQIIQAAGGTLEGVIALVKGVTPYYTELQAINALPYDRYADAAAAFFAKVENNPNPFVKLLLPALQKARSKEFLVQNHVAMLRAAVQFRLHGGEGLKSVTDPCGAGPFEYRRFVYEKVDRGFELRSAYVGESPDFMIFVEKSGPYFRVLGPSAGKAPDAK